MNILAVYRVLLLHSVFCVILVEYQAKLPLDFQILNQTSGGLGQHMTHLAILENETMSRFIPRITGISTQGNVTHGVGLASRVSEEFVFHPLVVCSCGECDDVDDLQCVDNYLFTCSPQAYPTARALYMWAKFVEAIYLIYR